MHTKDVRYERLQDTLQKLKRKLDFRPLDSAEAYAFINKYYLPGLDTTLTKRRLLIHPLTSKNYQAIFDADSILLTKQYNGDTLKKSSDSINEIVLLPPEPLSIKSDNRVIWNKHKLDKASLIIDTFISNNDFNQESIQNWRKKVGYGYMMVSYPLYNKNTHVLVIHDWIENGDWCGTSSGHDISYHKIPGGWQKY
jgi:hypothetical protein